MPSPRPSKRQRIGRACDQCRHRKSRCDGEQPVCSICRSTGRACTYQIASRHRGLQSGYVRSLEVALGLVLDRFPGNEGSLRRILRDTRQHTLEVASELADRGRHSKLARDVGRLLNGETDKGQSPSDDDPESEVMCAVDENGGERQATQPPKESASPSDCLDCPFPENSDRLLQFYFTHIHSWFPIVERREVLRSLHTPPQASKSARDVSCRLVLWAIVAYSSAMDDTLEKSHGPMQIAHAIRLQVLMAPDEAEIGHLQSLLIITLLHLGWGDLRLAWLLAGEVTRMLMMLPESSRTVRYQHTLHGCILLDNLISGILDKAPGISLDDVSHCEPVSEDDVDEWELWTGEKVAAKGPLRSLSTFNLINELMKRPYGGDSASPSLLTLHLTADFVVFCLALHKADSTVGQLALHSLHTTVDMLDTYVRLTGTAKSSPLLRCFIFQAYRCLRIVPMSSPTGPLHGRLVHLIHQLKLTNSETNAPEALFTWLPGRRLSGPMTVYNEYHLNLGNPDHQMATPELSITPVIPMPGQLDQTEDFDALFEEMVSSSPQTRGEPTFAENLGFYAGNLDADFLEQLQHIPDTSDNL
ncbi:hypothetical protein BO94DRAFT_596340 [Aspergillus sclerotioniger CBS 115572]|uniref:Zn(2)-C6 fungal-type domain-containing protein n=1 Tax=Aspergillus sclerotioniger CBS 115572 TaxID=1450535 RepID=A0A317WPE5_9EURO|nr:hypothetical protein BO94DRAFT_596340 [Aspergillus sclerotioniger CBS 115572]PWY87132.1 hypothetical protein BO94DRAFT_596340 [Aspergillus sclerotioniger CBS 115572]